MLGHAEPTPLDLCFNLFGIPIRIHPFFWLSSALLGWSSDPKLVLLWIVAVFVSILIHELGHALVAQRYGVANEVVLYWMGGYASFIPGRRHTVWPAIYICFAGPAAGFLFLAFVIGVRTALERYGIRLPYYAQNFYLYLYWINLVVGLMNLVPVYPLDGGQISRYFLSWYLPRRGLEMSLIISGVAGLAAAYYAYYELGLMFAVLMVMLAVESFSQLSQSGRRY